MADETQTPDMVGAGVRPGPEMTDQMGMVNALRSVGGSLPQGALQAPNIGLAIGSGALSQPGQNQYLQGFQQQQMAQQREQRLQQDRLMQAVENTRRQQMSKNRMALQMYDETLKDLNDPEERQRLLTQRNSLFQQLGASPLSPGAIRDLANKRLSPEKMDEIRVRLQMGANPDQLSQIYGVPPQRVQEIAQLPMNPATAKAMGLKSDTELKQEALRLHGEELKSRATDLGVEVGSPVYNRMITLAKKPFGEMSDGEVNLLKTRAELDVSSQDITKKMSVVQQTEAIKHTDRMAEIQARELAKQKTATNNPLLKPQIVKLRTELNAMPALAARKDRVKAAVELLNKEGLLTTGGTLPEWALIQAKAGTKFGRADINAAFQTLQRFGTPLLLSAEKDIAGQPIGSVLRLKSVAQAEIGGINRIPYAWWQDFFTDYEKGVSNRQDFLRSSLDAMGVEPGVPNAGPSGKTSITREQYDTLVKKGYSREQIGEKYAVTP